MNAKSVIVSLILAVVFFGIGLSVGIFWPAKNVSVQVQETVTPMPKAIRDLSSKVISSIAAYGAVTKIDGQNITLSYQGDSVIIPIKADAKIYSFAPASDSTKTGTAPKGTPSQIPFKDIKISDNLSVNLKVLLSGQTEGFSVIVLPPTSPASNPVTTK